uniref:Uncharacterized protein n=1 Tax=Oryza glumipatula TaxID=40148 RepID=A0A0E0AHX4_9ORYZ
MRRDCSRYLRLAPMYRIPEPLSASSSSPATAAAASYMTSSASSPARKLPSLAPAAAGEAVTPASSSSANRSRWPASPTNWSKLPPEDAPPGGTKVSLVAPGSPPRRGATVEKAFDRSSQTVTGSKGAQWSSSLDESEALRLRGGRRPSRGYYWGSTSGS